MRGRVSVQSRHVLVQAIAGDVAMLRDGGLRGVLEVSGVDFALLGAGEREALVAGYAALLNGLSYPVQLLARVLPVDTEAYLSALQARLPQGVSQSLAALARDHAAFLRRLARNRTLLERRYYVVVPAGEGEAVAGRFLRGGKRAVGEPLAARKQLAFRCAEVARGLAGCGLGVRRLSGVQLAQFFYSCWCPGLARLQRLERELAGREDCAVSAARADRQRRESL